MRWLSLFLFMMTAFTIFVAEAAYSYGPSPTIPGHRNKCYVQQLQRGSKLLPKGKTSFRLKECGRAKCISGKGGKLYLEVATCGVISVPCPLVSNPSARYPKCCPKPKCR